MTIPRSGRSNIIGFLVASRTSTSSRAVLRKILEQRVGKNPRYSLRAMARDSGISASHLSQILGGKRRVSLQTALKLSERLGLPTGQAEALNLLTQLEASNSLSVKRQLRGKLRMLDREFIARRGNERAIEAVGEWYHVAIMEMTFLEPTLSGSVASKRLGISTGEASAALKSLCKLGFLVEKSDGKYVKPLRNIEFRHAQTNAAFETFHDTMMALGRFALKHHPFEERVFNSQTFSISRKKVPAARELMREFLRSMAVLLDDDDDQKTDVYQLSVQFFNLTDGVPIAEKRYKLRGWPPRREKVGH